MPLAIVVLIVLVEAAAGWLAFQPDRAGEASFWWLAGGPSALIAIGALVRAQRRGELGAWLRVRGGDFSAGALVAGLLFGAAYLFAHYVTPPGSTREVWLMRLYLQLGDPDVLRAHPGIVLLGLIAAAASEEIVWRGLVADLLEERFGDAYAWILQAVAYALAMVPTMVALAPAPGRLNPLLPIAALGCGVAWGFLVRTRQGLAASIASHAFFDWAVVVLFRLWGVSL
jgi:membrane protease YdiL (CAAX protease family)